MDRRLAAGLALLTVAAAVALSRLPTSQHPAIDGTTIVDAATLSALVADQANQGRVVLAKGDVTLRPLRCLGSCWEVTLVGTQPPLTFNITTDPPQSAGAVLALRIGERTVDYLGPVALKDGQAVWKVPEILAGGHDQASDELFAVDAWLVATSPAPCIGTPINYPPETDMGYWCGRSWLTAEPMYTVSSDQHSFSFVLPGGIHVQWDAYELFAPSTGEGVRGSEPSHGFYLVHSVGCPQPVMGDCPVWAMVGRLAP